MVSSSSAVGSWYPTILSLPLRAWLWITPPHSWYPGPSSLMSWCCPISIATLSMMSAQGWLGEQACCQVPTLATYMQCLKQPRGNQARREPIRMWPTLLPCCWQVVLCWLTSHPFLCHLHSNYSLGIHGEQRHPNSRHWRLGYHIGCHSKYHRITSVLPVTWLVPWRLNCPPNSFLFDTLRCLYLTLPSHKAQPAWGGELLNKLASIPAQKR